MKKLFFVILIALLVDTVYPATAQVEHFAPSDAPPDSASSASPASARLSFAFSPAPAPVIERSDQSETNIQWKTLTKNSLFLLGVMQGFRLGTEGGTREALHNSIVGGYFKALGSMHGWSDGDGYYENYLGHPIQGGVTDYVWIHNDPRYRNVEFGKSRDYWMGRLRAYGYSWAFSEQFEVGLLSEASIGQIQRYCCAYGFVDHVVTPNFGMAWLIGGDIIDRYVTRPFEDRTTNITARSLVRSLINPPQTFANMMMMQKPWHRENRASPTEYAGQLYSRTDFLASVRFIPSLVPKFELTAAMPSVTRMGGQSCLGGSGVAGFRIDDSWQWTAEVGGCNLAPSLPKHWGGDSLIFNTGPQWIMHNSSRWSPHVHFRAGGQKITRDHCEVDGVHPDGLFVGKPCKSEPSFQARHYESTGFSISAGGGLDIKLNNALAVRVANLDYMHSWLQPVAGTDYNQGLRFTTGIVLRVGTW